MSGFTYRAFGMVIHSELELPELLPAEGAADLEIGLGAVPDRLAGATAEGASFQATTRELLLSVDGLARFHATGGRRVMIERINGGSEIDVRAYVLGPVMAALLQQRGLLPLHASAIEADRAAVLFIGACGSGKSTLAATMARRGYRLVADDVAALLVQGDSIVVVPGFPQLKLWSDVVERLGERVEALSRADSVRDKYGLAARDAFCPTPLPLRRAYVLEPTAGAVAVGVAPVLGSAKVMVLLANTYRQQFLGTGEARVPNFEQCASVAARVDLFRATRPPTGDFVEPLAAMIDRDLGRPA